MAKKPARRVFYDDAVHFAAMADARLQELRDEPVPPRCRMRDLDSRIEKITALQRAVKTAQLVQKLFQDEIQARLPGMEGEDAQQ